MPYVKLVAAVDDPIGCKVCGRAWDFVTDGINGIGRLRAVHPAGPCVPREYEPDEAVGIGVSFCQHCRGEYVKRSNAQRYCSGKCCELGCKHTGNRARLRRYWQRRAA